ncbi:hypothetical protein [Nonomuraea sp. NPDC046570]|uniref:hypothetical protein n=1 Tax=Nonomuraea sp. NPDC046570 TaxID=3155255 RepID=UPI0033C0ED32
MPEIANILWAAVAAGGLERVGAYGTEATVTGLKSLWQLLRDHRMRKGLPETPQSRDELYEGLVALLAEDPETPALVRKIDLTTIEAEQVVSTVINGTVTMWDGTIGISNGPRR